MRILLLVCSLSIVLAGCKKNDTVQVAPKDLTVVDISVDGRRQQ